MWTESDEFFQQNLKYKHAFIQFKKHGTPTCAHSTPADALWEKMRMGVTEAIDYKGIGSWLD